MFDHCPNKQNVLQCLIKCLLLFKFYQTQFNMIKRGVQTGKYVVTKQCLMTFDLQTFPIWTGLYHTDPKPKQACIT